MIVHFIVSAVVETDLEYGEAQKELASFKVRSCEDGNILLKIPESVNVIGPVGNSIRLIP